MTKDQEQIFTIVRRVMKTSLSCFRHQNAARDRRTPPAGLVLLASLMALWGLVCMATSAARADEGMWTFDNPPAKQLQRYGFTPTPEWLDHVRLSSVSFNDGGSGSFVSPHGLVLTNHHVAFGQWQKVSTPQKDYVKDGFYARTPAQELKCPDLELNVLISIENVTARVESVLKPGMSDKDALEARKAEIAKIENMRDDYLPTALKILNRRLGVLKQYSELGPEEAREAARQMFGIENTLKAFNGQYEGLLDKALIAKKQKEESDFRALVDASAEWKREYGTAWDDVAQAEKKFLERLKQARFTSVRASSMAQNALTIVQYVTEVKKPDGKRLDGYHDSELESLRFRLFSPAPVYPRLEEALLADSLHQSLEELGADDPFVRAALGARTPKEAAQDVISRTKMGNPDFRKSLVEGGEAAVAASADPLIVMARKVDPVAREIRKWVDDNVESVETTAGEKIGKARFAAYGKSTYPDATFTLRLSYGTVKGYPMNGTEAPPKTTLYGLYDRADSFGLKPPFDLPQRYLDRRGALELSTPINFVSTCDIIGGNSGSPVINKNAELVGLIFDGNIESLVGDYVYNIENNRAVAVHTGAMTEALRKLYDAGALADELEGRM